MSLARIDDYSYHPVSVNPENRWIELMQPAAELAAQIANTDFVPESYRRNPAAIAACILFGAEIGLPPMQSLSKIDIVKGRPAPRAEIARAKALAAGHEFWVDESTNTRVTVGGKRRGSTHTFSVTWTMDDAKKAGIAGNPSYAKYPRQMLLARASAELVRQMCPEVLGGITVFAEEAEALDGDPVEVAGHVADPPKATNKRKREPKPEPVEAIVVEAGPSEAQTKKAMALFAEVGITERDDRLHATAALIGHSVSSWSECTRDEGSQVIDGLERINAGMVSFRIEDDGTWSLEFPDDDEPTLDVE